MLVLKYSAKGLNFSARNNALCAITGYFLSLKLSSKIFSRFRFFISKVCNTFANVKRSVLAFSSPIRPAGLLGKTFLMNIPNIAELLSGPALYRSTFPPTILIPRLQLGSLTISTYRSGPQCFAKSMLAVTCKNK